jgi:hypothetical protein
LKALRRSSREPRAQFNHSSKRRRWSTPFVDGAKRSAPLVTIDPEMFHGLRIHDAGMDNAARGERWASMHH